MIKKIKSIKNFAVFNDFDWDSTVRDKGNNIAEFKKLNILYGRNYTGKTTISRIFRSIQEKKLPDKYPTSLFEIITADNTNINQNNLTTYSLDIRVYNSDFVNENLAFLKNEEGEITPFAILGEENIKIEEQISKKELELGSEEKKSGLKYKLFQKGEELQNKKKEKSSEEIEIEVKLKEKANQQIKRNLLYNDVTYNINNIKNDIEFILKNPLTPLADAQIDEKKLLLKEDAKSPITKIDLFISNFQILLEETNEILKKAIKPTESIQELLDNAILQEWVRKGIPQHKNIRQTCAFCGNKLSDDLWEKLDAHFNKESEDLRNAISKAIKEIEQNKIDQANILKLNKDNFYTSYQTDFISYKKNLEDEIKNYNKSLDTLIAELDKRDKDIFNLSNTIELINYSKSINDVISKFNILIENNNNKTTNLNSEQGQTRNELRLNEISEFIKNIDYEKKLLKINVLKEQENLINTEYESINEKVKAIEKEIENLRIQQKDERKGADKINNYLNHFFGNDSIKFEAIEVKEESRYKFQVMRGNEIAHKLSEGECSLVAFCYFMAKLEDIESKDKELIIWIDDPICSLDNNHIFFLFSLIEAIIAKPYKKPDNSNGYNYKQFFVSTHNIDFLKYLKSLSKPKKEKKDDVQYFLLERHNQESKIQLMPDYLKSYTTEFNYLFHQIYKCSKIIGDDSTHETFYNFANNLRKFLEAYLFYKYPSNRDIIVKLNRFFKDDTSVALANRISNELSHLEEIFDRSMKPIEIPEIPKLANYVLNKIKEKDPDQYNALIMSIGEAGGN